MRTLTTLLALTGLLVPSLTTPVPKRPILKRELLGSGPVIRTDFPDPSIILVDNVWHAFGTQSLYNYTSVKTQYATSPDFTTWTLQENYDALRTLPSWVDSSNPQIWAPDVFALDDGGFMMYFSAATASNPFMHCVGAARSKSVSGPYDSVTDEPVVCPADVGGAIDASAFRDSNGRRYMLYKEDGNSIGPGGTCSNTDQPQVDTWNVIQEVSSDGYTFINQGYRVLNRDAADGPLIEAPALARYGSKYVWFFSSQCYTNVDYDTSYAVSDRIDGGYTKARLPLLEQKQEGGNLPLGPGGADVDVDGEHMAFHGYASESDVGQVRSMYVATISFDDGDNTVSY